MERNTVYKLNKNLDLKNENFLVKKGTIVTILEKFNEIDNDKPTVVSLKFENIIGKYQFDEKELKAFYDKNFFKIYSVPLYSKNDCVKDITGKKGIVDVEPEFDIATKEWEYKVNYNGVIKPRLERQLSRCS